MKPFPKIKRVVDRNEIIYVRYKRDGFCIAGLELKENCVGALHVHHIKTKGSGGDDVRENLITLCTKHHHGAHGGTISKEQMYGWLEKRYKYGCQRENSSINSR